MYIDPKTIITPAARDTARIYGIEFSNEENNCKQTSSQLPKTFEGEIDSNMVYTVIKALVEHGLLKELFERLPEPPYLAECDSGGLKVVRGHSVRFDVLDTGNPNNKVFYQELISSNKSSMKAGFLTIEKSSFDWESSVEEMNYVIEGTVTIGVNGKNYTACPGDVVYLPTGSKITWNSPDKAKLFYATFSAN